MSTARDDGMDEGLSILLNEVLTEQRATRQDIKLLSDSVSQLQLVNAEKKGERRVVVWLAGALSAAISLAVSVLRS